MKAPLKSVLFLCLAIICSTAWAQDSTISTTIAPGVVHTHYTRSGPYSIHVLEIDLSDTSYHVEAYRPSGLVATSLQTQYNDRDGHRVLAAINADFFSYQTGWPLGNNVVNGEIILGTLSLRSHFAMNTSNRPVIERFTFRGSIKTSTGKSFPLKSVNQSRKLNSIILYTPRWTAKTEIDVIGTECVLRPLSQKWWVSDTIRCVVNEINSLGNGVIPAAGGILWASNNEAGLELKEKVHAGETLAVYAGFEPSLEGITQVVGGAGRILLNGRPVAEEENGAEKLEVKFLRDKHPRTFVGFNRDTTKLFLCTVDGRQASSIGMNFKEMADFLLSIGAWNAVNLDGGGSTTMVIQGAIVNSPSDKTGERSVANSLQLISTKVTRGAGPQ